MGTSLCTQETIWHETEFMCKCHIVEMIAPTDEEIEFLANQVRISWDWKIMPTKWVIEDLTSMGNGIIQKFIAVMMLEPLWFERKKNFPVVLLTNRHFKNMRKMFCQEEKYNYDEI